MSLDPSKDLPLAPRPLVFTSAAHSILKGVRRRLPVVVNDYNPFDNDAYKTYFANILGTSLNINRPKRQVRTQISSLVTTIVKLTN